MAKSAANHPNNTPQKPTFRPLTVAQENAIDALILGQTDGEVAAAVRVDRGTVWSWRHEHPLFRATLEQRRAELWRAPQDKLRALAMKAAENLAAAVESGDLRASVDLLKCIGLYGVVAPTGETDPVKIMRAQIDAQLDRDFPQENDVLHEVLIDQVRPGSYKRKFELEAEYRERYLK